MNFLLLQIPLSDLPWPSGYDALLPGSSLRWVPTKAGWPGRYINLRCCGGLSMVLLQLKDPLELFVKRREFQIPLFPVYTRSGEVTVSIDLQSSSVVLTVHVDKLVHFLHPQIPLFPVYTRSGEVTVSIDMQSSSVVLTVYFDKLVPFYILRSLCFRSTRDLEKLPSQ